MVVKLASALPGDGACATCNVVNSKSKIKQRCMENVGVGPVTGVDVEIGGECASFVAELDQKDSYGTFGAEVGNVRVVTFVTR